MVLSKGLDWRAIEGAARREGDVRLGRNRYVLGVADGAGGR